MVAGPASEAASAEPAGEAWLEDSLAPFNEMANAIANAFLLSAQELEGRRADDRVLFERVIKNHDKQVRMLGGALSEIERRLGPIDGLVAEQQSLAERAESNFSKFSVEVRDLGQRLRAAEDDHKQTEKAIQERTDAVSTALNGRCAQLAAGLEAAREEVKQLTGALADARTEIKTLTSRVDRQAAAIRAMYQSEMLSSI
jgi:chromosome segregation ATPase